MANTLVTRMTNTKSETLTAVTDLHISVTCHTTYLSYTAANPDVILADGLVHGQLKKIQLTTTPGDITVTVANCLDGTTLKFTDAGDVMDLIWLAEASKWRVISLSNHLGTNVTPTIS